MESINMIPYPISAGFLFPDGTFFDTNGKGHEWLANRILEDKFGVDTLNIQDPEFILQSEYSAILIRYCRGKKLVYLPKIRPQTTEGRYYFKKAVKFYEEEGFQVLNLYKISLENDFSTIESFIGETFEEFLGFTECYNYTNTIIRTSDGTYMYNPERIGD